MSLPHFTRNSTRYSRANTFDSEFESSIDTEYDPLKRDIAQDNGTLPGCTVTPDDDKLAI